MDKPLLDEYTSTVKKMSSELESVREENNSLRQKVKPDLVEPIADFLFLKKETILSRWAGNSDSSKRYFVKKLSSFDTKQLRSLQGDGWIEADELTFNKFK